MMTDVQHLLRVDGDDRCTDPEEESDYDYRVVEACSLREDQSSV